MRRLHLMFVMRVGVGTAALGCSATETPPTTSNTGGSRSGSGGSAAGSGGNLGGAGGTSNRAGGSGGSATGSGGSTGTGGSGPLGAGGTTTSTGGTTGDAGTSADGPRDTVAPTPDGGLPKFSFFVTSIDAMRALSKSPKGFGGDLRFGKADGLSGADEICRQTAEMGMAGAGQKTWRAYLSAVAGGPGGTPVNAIDRVGEGPWYDRLGRIVSMTKADLAANRPRGAHPAIINDLPNEKGIPNQFADGDGKRVDNHHTLTGSKADGTVYSTNKGDTCQDWTSSVGNAGSPRCGVSWPRNSGDSWAGWGPEGGCAPGINLIEGASPTEGDMAVGSRGGYGGIYCFATTP